MHFRFPILASILAVFGFFVSANPCAAQTNTNFPSVLNGYFGMIVNVSPQNSTGWNGQGYLPNSQMVLTQQASPTNLLTYVYSAGAGTYSGSYDGTFYGYVNGVLVYTTAVNTAESGPGYVSKIDLDLTTLTSDLQTGTGVYYFNYGTNLVVTYPDLPNPTGETVQFVNTVGPWPCNFTLNNGIPSVALLTPAVDTHPNQILYTNSSYDFTVAGAFT